MLYRCYCCLAAFLLYPLRVFDCFEGVIVYIEYNLHRLNDWYLIFKSFYSDFGIVSIRFFARWTYYSEVQLQNVDENTLIWFRAKAKLVNLVSFGSPSGI